MKKSVAIIAGVVLVGGGLWLGGAWYTGTRLEAISPEQVAQFNADVKKAGVEGDAVMRQLSFERGLFASQARYALTFRNEGEELTLEFDTRYEHGPFPLSALSHGQFTPTMAFVRSDLARTAELEPWFEIAQGPNAPLWAEALVSYSGDTDFRGSISPVKLDEDEGKVDFKGATLQGIYTHATQRTVGSFNAPGFAASSDALTAQPFDLAVDDVQLDLDLARGKFDAYTGDVELRIERVTVARPDLDSRVAIDKLVYGGTSSEDERFLKGDAYLRGKSLRVNDFDLGDLSWMFKLEQLDGASLQRMREAIRELSAKTGDATSDPEQFFGALAQDFQTFLGGQPKIAIGPFSWKNGKGESTLDVRTELTAPDDINVPSVRLLMESLKTVNIDLKLHKPMVTELAATLLRLTQDMDAATANALVQQQYDTLSAQLVQVGLAKKDGENLVSTVRYDGENEQVTVNGREVSPGELMGLMMLF